MKKQIVNIGISYFSGTFRFEGNNNASRKATAKTNRGNQGPRPYQRSLSKVKMKLSRYRASGTTHRSGTGEMFCVMWVVTATNNVEGQKAKPIQSRRWLRLGRSAS